MLAMSEHSDIEWKVSEGLVPYAEALAFMEERAAAIRAGSAPECVWLLEHPPLFTAGTSADPAELSNPHGFPVFEAGRGGRYTYHGPGQRVGYVMLDLEKRGRDIRRFVHGLEGWIIATLGRFGRCRAPRARAHRHLGRRRPGGSENRRVGRPREALGDDARLRHQRRARACSFRRNRAVRHRRISA